MMYINLSKPVFKKCETFSGSSYRKHNLSVTSYKSKPKYLTCTGLKLSFFKYSLVPFVKNSLLFRKRFIDRSTFILNFYVIGS